MSMNGNFASLSPANWAEFVSGTIDVEGFLFPSDDEAPPHHLGLDKAWHGIHYLLTGEVEGGEPPYSRVVFGGKEHGPDLGYGSARIVDPQQVSVIAQALAALPIGVLEKRYEPAELTRLQIYPGDIWVREGHEAYEWLSKYYERVVLYYQQAANRGDGVVQWLD